MVVIFWLRGIQMKLTHKDKEFLESLKAHLNSRDLDIELKSDGVKRLVLRKNYGDKIEKVFKMTRQGVRWRFNRLFNEIYVSSLETLYWIESNFGTSLRSKALEIARERVELRKKARQTGFFEVSRRERS